MKILKILLLFVVLIVIGTFLFRNTIAKVVVSGGIKNLTGLTLTLQSIDVGIPKTIIGIKDMKLYNPSNYEDRLMVDMPEIYVDYDLGAILKNYIHLENVRLDLKDFIVVKNKNGELNINSLKVVKDSTVEKETKPESKKERGEKPQFKIDILELKIGKVIYKDYSGSSLQVKGYNININERYENITDPQAFIRLIVVKALMNTNIANLANFDLRSLENITSGALNKTVGQLEKTLQGTVGVGKTLEGSLSEGAKDVTEKTTEAIKNILPFGK